jgi:chromosome partitioning protein
MFGEVNMSNGTVMEISPKTRRKAGEGRKSKQAAKEGGDITIRHTKRLLITGPKGGLGKTTLARTIAVCAAQDDLAVAIVDLDPQKSLLKWYARRPEEMSRIELLDAGMEDAKELMELDGYDLIIIDTPPGIEAYPAAIQDLTTGANLTLVPCGPSIDEWEIIIPWMQRITRLALIEPSYIMSRYTRTTLSAQDTKLKLSRNGRLCPIELPASEDIKRAGELGLGVSEIRRAYGSKEARGIWEYVRHELGL